jgi:hypothetical protein
VEAWIRPTAAQAGSTHQIVSAHDVAGGQESGYALAVVGGTPPKIRGRIWHGTGAPAEVSFTVSAGFGSRWWYVALTYDGSVMGLFVDGAPAPVPQGETATGLRQNTAFPLRIGAERAGAQSAPADFFAGGVDEVAIYSRALTAAEIKTRFDLSKKKT